MNDVWHFYLPAGKIMKQALKGSKRLRKLVVRNLVQEPLPLQLSLGDLAV
jgi:hypothetical protein